MWDSLGLQGVDPEVAGVPENYYYHPPLCAGPAAPCAGPAAPCADPCAGPAGPPSVTSTTTPPAIGQHHAQRPATGQHHTEPPATGQPHAQPAAPSPAAATPASPATTPPATTPSTPQAVPAPPAHSNVAPAAPVAPQAPAATLPQAAPPDTRPAEVLPGVRPAPVRTPRLRGFGARGEHQCPVWTTFVFITSTRSAVRTLSCQNLRIGDQYRSTRCEGRSAGWLGLFQPDERSRRWSRPVPGSGWSTPGNPSSDVTGRNWGLPVFQNALRVGIFRSHDDFVARRRGRRRRRWCPAVSSPWAAPTPGSRSISLGTARTCHLAMASTS